jgi:hypothetical protein
MRLGEAKAGKEKNITQGIGVTAGAGAALGFLTEEGIAAENALDSQNEVTSGLRFQDVALSPGSANVGGESRGMVHGKNENLVRKSHFPNLSSEFEAADARHGDIQNDEVGLEVCQSAQSLVGVGSFAGNFPFGAKFSEESSHALSNDLVIIND